MAGLGFLETTCAFIGVERLRNWHRRCAFHGANDLWGMARVPLLDATDLPEEFRYLVSDNAVGELDLFRAMGHAPACMQSYMRYGTALWEGGGLSPRRRELAILAVARAINSEYEWHQHVTLGLQAGLDIETIRAIGRGNLSSLDEPDRTLADYVVAAAEDGITDEQHATAAERFDDGTLVAVALLAGYYVATDRFLSAFDVSPESAFVGWEPEAPA